ncbi:hypothetical protein QBC42DRAFT_328073 [Cladorrhinum samala]|uniref:Cytochrome c oxidase assembly protein COX20, mitochondrial n=1 Tax=Cladorrhinum samala TaxID=585594 RepID=A0AAV9HMM8_9PEZI|nr:hypothetical protein QBC42DRAFT_328073 [Cladorrhinum samala]
MSQPQPQSPPPQSPPPSSEQPPPWVSTPSSQSQSQSQPKPHSSSSSSSSSPSSSTLENQILSAAQTIKPSDFLTFHQAPCARSGLLTGIGSGAALGVVRWLVGAPIPKAANWAVGAGVLGAIGQYEYCQFRRRQEKEKVKRVVEVYSKVQAEAKAKEAAAAVAEEKEAARKRAEAKAGGGILGRLKFW